MKQEKKEYKGKKQFALSLKAQLIIGFAAPILLLIAVGMISYYNASSGMIENYENSAVNALEMTMECLERGFSPCVTNALELANNTTVSSYVQGGYDTDSSRQSTARQASREQGRPVEERMRQIAQMIGTWRDKLFLIRFCHHINRQLQA